VITDERGEATRSKVSELVKTSFVSAFRVVVLISAVMAVLAGLTAWLMIQREP